MIGHGDKGITFASDETVGYISHCCKLLLQFVSGTIGIHTIDEQFRHFQGFLQDA